MKYRRLGKNGDYTFGQGTANFLTGAEAVAQAVKTKILLLSAEWWEDLEDGTPLFDGILLQRSSEEGKKAVDLIVRDRLLGVEGVVQVSSFASTLSDGYYQANVTVETLYGETADVTIDLGV